VSAAALAAAGAVACLIAALDQGQRAHAAAPRRPAPRRDRLVVLLVGLGRRTGVPAAPRDLGGRIAAAGLDLQLDPADVMALKAGAVLAVLLAGTPLAVGLPGALLAPLAVAAPAGAFLAPDRWLARRVARRVNVMTAEAADLLDLLRVAVAAGLPVARAMDEVGRRHPGLLAAELRRAGREIAVGMPRARALDGLAARCPLPAIGALVAAVRRADRHGVPLGPALAALAADSRADRARALADAAARAAPKIQLVIALLLVPGVLLLVAAALVASLTG